MDDESGDDDKKFLVTTAQNSAGC